MCQPEAVNEGLRRGVFRRLHRLEEPFETAILAAPPVTLNKATGIRLTRESTLAHETMRWSKLARFYLTIDLRSLALFRVLFGLVWIADWFGRWPRLQAFYTNDGVLPSYAQLSIQSSEYHYSFLVGAMSLPMVQALFLLGLGCYVAFLLGIYTRLFHVASVVFYGSVLARNEIITNGGDTVMVAMALWTMFLPLGKRFSVDALRSAAPSDSNAAAERSRPSLAAFAAVAQIGLIYTLSAFVKATGQLWQDGLALYYALQLDNFARPIGLWLGDAPTIVNKVLTYATLAMEGLGLPLILLPWPRPLLRRVLIISLGLMHIGTIFILDLFTFPFIMMTSFALLLGQRDWDFLLRVTRKPIARMQKQIDAIGRFLFGLFGSRGQVPQTAPPGGVARWRNRVLVGIEQAFVGLVFCLVLWDGYNLNWAKPRDLQQIPEPRWMRATLESLQLIHAWYMFAPDPMVTDGWWVINAITESGARVDPLTGRPPTWQKPPNLSQQWGPLWRTYMLRITLPEYHKYRVYLGHYLTQVDRQTKGRGQKMLRFDLYYITEPTQPPGTPKPFPTKPEYLWSFNCTIERLETNGPLVP